ncbi:MAG: methyltransferase domain-containing protein [Clostridiaceae bacterium]|nr:methyltransferase domain-containing protein [Clostridiaceae bacterium]
MKIPFWEDSYKDDQVSTFGTQPNATIVEYEHLFSKSWSVLDVGCGDGKNSLYLSGLGYTEVEAFDMSVNAIAKLNRIASSKNLHVTAWVQDLTQFTFGKHYDLVMSFGTLHFVKK